MPYFLAELAIRKRSKKNYDEEFVAFAIENVDHDDDKPPSILMSVTFQLPAFALERTHTVVTDVELTVVVLEQGIVNTPFPRYTLTAVAKFWPVMVRFTVEPSTPLVGETVLMVGGVCPMVNSFDKGVTPYCPSGFVTLTIAFPIARPLRLNEPVICDEVTERPVPETGVEPASITSTVAPFRKLLPVMVSVTTLFWAPLVGEMLVILGGLPESVVATVVGAVGVTMGTEVTVT